jgi:uncharacterized membrane protein (DUF485 family)
MIGVNTKITFFNFAPYECGAAEEYLEVMAEKGWRLQSIKGTFLKFKRIEPKKLKYTVDILNKVFHYDPNDSDITLEYREYCEAAGWNYVCAKRKIQIFYTEEVNNTVSIQTDEEEKFKSVFKASLSYIVEAMIFILLLAYNLKLMLFSWDTEFTLATNTGLVSILASVFIILINVTEIISFLFWVIRAKVQLKRNGKMPYNSSKQLKINNLFKSIYTIVLSGTILRYFIIDEHASIEANIALLVIFVLPIVVAVYAERYLNKKIDSKDKRISVIFSGTFLTIYFTFVLLGCIAFKSTVEPGLVEWATEKATLTLEDFGVKAKLVTTPLISFDKNFVAERLNYINSLESNNLAYTVFQSKYPWIIKFDKERHFNLLSKLGMNLIPYKIELPGNVEVYFNEKEKHFLLVSEDKIVNLRQTFNNISSEEFINIVYKELFQ